MKKITVLLAAFLPFFWTSCGDKETEDYFDSFNDAQEVESFDDLLVCSDLRNGMTIFVNNENKKYECEDSWWIPYNEVDNNSPTKDDSADIFVDFFGECSASNVGEKKKSAGYVKCTKQGVWIASTTDLIKGTMTDSRDNKTYKTIGIGTQTWMAENLNYDYKVDDQSYGSYCYNDGMNYCNRYGRLYTWAAAMDSTTTECGWRDSCSITGNIQGICPEGWHLPDTTEWKMLFAIVGGFDVAGNALISLDGWNNCENREKQNADPYGFSAHPSGIRLYQGIYDDVGVEASFWTSSEISNSEDDARCIRLTCGSDNEFLLGGCEKNTAISIRCLKDATE